MDKNNNDLKPWRSEVTEIRNIAYYELEHPKYDCDVHMLMEALQDTDSKARRYAFRGLMSLNTEWKVEKLIEYLKHPNPSLRKDVAKILGMTGDVKVIEPLIECSSDEDRSVVGTVTRSVLPDFGDRAVKSLCRALKDERPSVRAGAATSLWAIANKKDIPLNKTWGSIDDRETTTPSLISGEIAESSTVNSLCGALLDSDRIVRYWAVAALGIIRYPGSFLALIATLDDPVALVRESAANALGNFGCEDAVEPLIERLGDPEDQVRSSVIGALGMLRSKDALPHLEKIANDDPNWIIKDSLVFALVRFDDPAVVEPLINILADENSPGREQAIEALGRLGDERAVEPLIRALEDLDYEVRINAADALRKIGHESAIEPLKSLFSDDEYDCDYEIFHGNPVGAIARNAVDSIRKRCQESNSNKQ